MLDSDKKYRVGQPVNYTSVYGYLKRKFPIIEAVSGNTVGHAKEERAPGMPGQPDVVCFYERSGLRKHGQLRFYQSVAALITAFGGQLVVGDVGPKDEVKKSTKATPSVKNNTLVSTYATKLGIRDKSLRDRMAKNGYGRSGFTERDIKKVFHAYLAAL